VKATAVSFAFFDARNSALFYDRLRAPSEVNK